MSIRKIKMLKSEYRKEENFECPKCRDGKGGLVFFVWEDEAKGLVVCSSCGFKKQFALNESHESTVDEIKRYRSEYAEQGNEESNCVDNSRSEQ